MQHNPPSNKTFRVRLLAFGVAAGLLFLPVTALAAALMEDGQDYAAAASTPAAGRSPWAINGSTSYIKILSGDLSGATTPDIKPLPNASNPEALLQIAKAGTGQRQYCRSLGNNIASGSVYFSFLLNVTANPTLTDEYMGSLIAGGASNTPAATDPLTLYARKGADTNHFDLGIQRLNGTTAWTGDLADNTTNLIVLKYTFGGDNRLYVNPTPGASEPPPTASAAGGATVEPANLGTVLFYESANAPVTSGTFQYDVMRADASWTNVTPSGGNVVAPNPMRLLLLGNSLLGISASYSNDIPAILLNLAQNLGDALTYTKIANSSWYLYQFAADTTATNDINTGNYDLVVLQDQSEEPSLPTPRNNSMFPACRSLNSMITNKSEKTMFYETWGYIDGDTTPHCSSYDIPAQYRICDGGFGSFSSMNTALRKGYSMIGTELGAAISPVGLAWLRVRTEFPALNLYILDDGFGDRHPNSYGAYLTACVFYSAIFGRSPEGSTYYSTNNVSDALYLQQVAAETVLADPFAADAYGFGLNHFYWAYNWQDYTNPAGSPPNTTVISGASAIPSPSVKVDANVGSVGNLWLGTLDTNFNKGGQGRLYLYPNALLVVTGAMIVGKEGKGFVQHNGGALAVNGALTLGEQTNSTGQYTLSNGTLYATQILPGAGGSAFNFQGGQLGFSQFGSAAQALNLSSVAGTLALTNTVGTSLLYGNFTNGSAATLSVQLGSSSNVLAISGAASLAGALSLGYANGFQPAPGQQFTLLSASSVSGNFTNLVIPPVGTNGLGLVTSVTATSVLATVVNYAPGLSVPVLATNSGFQFALAGVSGSQYAIQNSTNLVDWVSILTNTAPFTFTTNMANSAGRSFYRSIYLP